LTILSERIFKIHIIVKMWAVVDYDARSKLLRDACFGWEIISVDDGAKEEASSHGVWESFKRNFVKTSSGVFLSGTNASLHLGHMFSFSDGMEVGREDHVMLRFEFVVGIDLSDTETTRMIDVADLCIERK